MRTVRVREDGCPLISVFSIDEKELKSLKVLTFKAADKDWLKFIAANRTGKQVDNSYDIIIGPVANDQAIRTVNNYLKGYFSEDIAIQLLLPQKLKDQYAFKTDKALQMLVFNEVKQI